MNTPLRRVVLAVGGLILACAAIAARADEIPWEDRSWAGIAQPFTDTTATPMDVPLHPGTKRWLKDNAGQL